MSSFSDVDRSGSADGLAAYLLHTDDSLISMKSYIAAAAARRVRAGGLVVDVGCGLGRDLGRLAAGGAQPIGVDRSMAMLGRVTGTFPLLQADAAALPFRTGSLDGCRIERTLEHVAEPLRVVEEMRRVLRPGGVALAFEPDFSTFVVDSGREPASFLAGVLRARHAAIGGELALLLERNGFRVHDVVTESSRGYALSRLPVEAERVLARAVADGRVAAERVDWWLTEQHQRTENGTFRASWDKVLVVATRRRASRRGVRD